ncbi:protocadherin alpha-2-like [Strix uralensis]|uniref:protocadherin alpha-2-like n=1 Tax=Strix uralensis TaxID=36305 RepID=UPI003DA2B6BA
MGATLLVSAAEAAAGELRSGGKKREGWKEKGKGRRERGAAGLRNGGSARAAPPRCGGEPGCERGGAARGGQESRGVRAAAGSRAGPGRQPAAAAAMGVCGAPAVRVLVLAAAWALGGGQVRYSVPEEAKAGTVVGRLAQDLGLEAGEAEARRLRLVAQGRRASVEVSGASGALVVSSRLDREELCGKSAPCALRLEVLVERPLRVFHVELEVTDINDNAPLFPAARRNLSIAEFTTLPGSRFPLEGASDADIGANAQLSYTLSPSEHFTLDVKTADENRKTLFLVLAKALDRETVPVHRLVVTASDGGRPSLTGTMELVVSVLDVNDNAPQFNQSVYKVQLPESAAEGTLVVRVNATDTDLGIYGEVIYEIDTFVPPSASDVFSIDAKSGEIRLTGALDFETVNFYELHVKAKDRGSPPLSGHCSVELEVLDVNDNAPEVWVTSLSVPVAEDAPVGTVVALLSVSDRDSGANGRVRCAVWPAAPFGLVATFAGSYSLVLREALDRERVSEYEVEVRAEDGGAPPLRARRGVRVPVSDVNDNAPAFAQAVYTVLARENNAAGAELARLWARDPDEAGNGRVSYSVWEGGGGGAAAGGGWRAASSYVSVDAESGRLWALQPLDYEEVQVLQFEVRAVDAGEPPLCGNATVQLFVVDENDNAPALLPAAGGGPGPGAAGSAASGPGSGAWWAWAAWGAPAGQVVAKIRAVDADSGYNAWLRYELWEPRGKGPFRVGLYSGEVSTARALEEADGPRQRLVIVVRDHGEPARSATATLSVSLVEGAEAALAAAGSSSSSSSGSGLRAAEGGPAAAAAAATNVWLVVAICAVSSLFLLAVVLYGASRWAPRAAVLSGPGPATLVCASEVGSWSYSQRQSRSLCVADGAGKSDLMVFSPNFPPPPGPAAKETQPEPSALLDTPKHPNPDWRYSASLRAGMQSAVHMEEAAVLRGGPGGPDQQWPTVSSATPEPEAGEVSPPVGAGVNSNSWTFKFGPGNPKQGGPGELPDKFIIPGSPAIISIRQEPPNSQIDKSDFITFGKKEETKKKKKKKKGNKTQEKKEKGNSTTENSDQ